MFNHKYRCLCLICLKDAGGGGDDDLFADDDGEYDEEEDVTENAADIEDIPRDPEANAVTVSTTENTVIREEEEEETAASKVKENTSCICNLKDMWKYKSNTLNGLSSRRLLLLRHVCVWSRTEWRVT